MEADSYIMIIHYDFIFMIIITNFHRNIDAKYRDMPNERDVT